MQSIDSMIDGNDAATNFEVMMQVIWNGDRDARLVPSLAKLANVEDACQVAREIFHAKLELVDSNEDHPKVWLATFDDESQTFIGSSQYEPGTGSAIWADDRRTTLN